MSELSVSTGDRAVTLEFDESLYPRDALYGAAYIFIDRCYVHLDRPAGGRVSVSLRLKTASQASLDDLAGEFENELLGQSWRRQIIEENRVLIERISARASAGSAGPPGLDDLLSLDTGAETFEDPLGIAMSWEDKYKKKKPDAPAEATGQPAEAPADKPAEAPADKAPTTTEETPPKASGSEGSAG